ncbi:MAG: F0F1 ATP synthase subunit B [Elusimicrobia bacterium]|nr:F0F1 ATP synthase subunit B [Elusimicrobiota bacterium]
MGDILKPDAGLMFWTIVTFLTMVFLLKTFAWGPLLHAVEERERRLKEDREAAEKARNEAQKIQADLEARLAALDAKSREVLAQAQKDAEALRARHSAEAKEEAERLMEKTRATLEEEKRRLVGELRQEVANLSVQAAEKLVRKTIDAGVRKTVLDQFFQDIERPGKKN